MKTSIFPALSACALAFATLVAGCGGGGGGPATPSGTATPFPTSTSVPTGPGTAIPTNTPSFVVPTATSAPTPVATTLAGACNAATYTPNYSPASPNSTIDNPGPNDDFLLRWTGFPINVFVSSTDDATRTVTVNGFRRWETALNRTLFTFTNNRAAAEITVDFSAIADEDVLGTAQSSFSSRAETFSCEIILDFRPSKITSDQNKEYVAAHEMGHALGLQLHSPNRSDLMFPSIENRAPIPSQLDVNTLRTAYCDVFPTRNAATLRRLRNQPFFTVKNSFSKTKGCLCKGH